MKKILAIIISFVTCIALSACGATNVDLQKLIINGKKYNKKTLC